jgi:hypothetical protein
LRARHKAQSIPLEALAAQLFGDGAQPALVGRARRARPPR